MAYFLRFTETPQLDIERGTSYHLSGIRLGDVYDTEYNLLEGDEAIERVAELLGCDESDIVLFDNGTYAQAIGGLCCFDLESEDLQSAIKEAKGVSSGAYSYKTHGHMAYIFEGECYDLCPEGAVMTNAKLIQKI